MVFAVTDLTPEAAVFIATDTDDNVMLNQTPSITFGVPQAANAGINAFPVTVTADGTTTTTITVTLKDALNRPTPGKLITLSQGNGHSLITGPDPSVTDASGEIQFTASNLVNEVVTYTAVDVSDGDLPVPGNAVVTFNNGSGTACGQTASWSIRSAVICSSTTFVSVPARTTHPCTVSRTPAVTIRRSWCMPRCPPRQTTRLYSRPRVRSM